MLPQTLVLGLVAVLAAAKTPPHYNGWHQVWADDFNGKKGHHPNANHWKTDIGNPGVNGEWEKYTGQSKNLRLSGHSSLQILPQLHAGQWTSGKIESHHHVAPKKHKKTRLEAEISFGGAPAGKKHGIWPAFWLLGNSIKHGTPWPACGELDIMEQIDGNLIGHGTAHCDVVPGGICNEHTGLGKSINIPNNGFHKWRIQWDRTPKHWQHETIEWSMDGHVFQKLKGSDIGNHQVWRSLCNDPMYIILNVAVGGGWPGYPNSNTQTGKAVRMEVKYVAHYQK